MVKQIWAHFYRNCIQIAVFTVQWCCGRSLVISWLVTHGSPALGWVPSVLPSRMRGLWLCSPEGEGTSPGAFLGCFGAALRPFWLPLQLLFLRCFLEIPDHLTDPVCAPSFLWALLTPQLCYWAELKWQTHKTKHFHLAGTAGLCHRNTEIPECCWIDMDNPGSNVHFVTRG